MWLSYGSPSTIDTGGERVRGSKHLIASSTSQTTSSALSIFGTYQGGFETILHQFHDAAAYPDGFCQEAPPRILTARFSVVMYLIRFNWLSNTPRTQLSPRVPSHSASGHH